MRYFLLFFSFLCISVPTAQAAEKYVASLWVSSDRLNRRTCPSTDCGVVGQYFYRAAVGIYEIQNGWGRVTKYYYAACETGKSEWVDEGNADCIPENGIVNGRFAEWVSLRYLSRTRAPDPGAGMTGLAKILSKSDDFRIYKDVFLRVSKKLIDSGTCTAKDYKNNWAWLKSSNYRDRPIYFTYCGKAVIKNRIYLDASNGRVFR